MIISGILAADIFTIWNLVSEMSSRISMQWLRDFFQIVSIPHFAFSDPLTWTGSLLSQKIPAPVYFG